MADLLTLKGRYAAGVWAGRVRQPYHVYPSSFARGYQRQVIRGFVEGDAKPKCFAVILSSLICLLRCHDS